MKRYDYLTDHLGSVRATVNDDGEVVHDDDFYPFGLRMDGRSMVADAPRENFTGHELDDEFNDGAGLLYMGARYMDPTIGRFLTIDPLADQFASYSPYNYVKNNPLILIDPTGMAPELAGCCSLGGTLRRTFGWAQRRVDEGAQAISDARDVVVDYVSGVTEAAVDYVSDVTETVVKDGPEVLDAVSGAAGMTAVAAGGAAVITGPTPDDAVHLTVAGVAATTSTIASVTAMGLVIVDAQVYGGDGDEAVARAVAIASGLVTGGAASTTFRQAARQTPASSSMTEGASKAIKTAAGALGAEAAKEVIEDEDSP
ncbi:MAG: RHS repeat-associated core domain-containing protein [Bacteroidota bacterium]